MLPGVELARRRRVHYHGDVAAAAEHAHHYSHHHYAYAHAHHAAQAPTGVAGPALAARIRLEEKLRGSALPTSTSSSPSRWSRLMRDGRSSTPSPRRTRPQITVTRRDEQEDALPAVPASTVLLSTRRRRAELTRTLSKAEVCAVCLEEVRERQQRVTRLPCSHKYHSECVLPWLAIHPDCPCCRALVPSSANDDDTLVQASSSSAC